MNTSITQEPSRWIINFFDWDEEYCRNNYPECFEIIERLVKPERTRWEKDENGKDVIGQYALRKPLPQKWWIYADKRPALYRTIAAMDKVLVVARISRTVAFEILNKNQVFADALVVFSTFPHLFFSLLQSTIHNNWSWHYCTTMKTDLNYTPGNTFETFPFPQALSKETEEELEKIGKEYHEFRRQLMLNLQLGLTKTYNLFHKSQLTTGNPQLLKAKLQISIERAINDIYTLRALHKQMDETVLKAYCWTNINLAHNFYEVDYLPENDRIRYTISPEARKEILKRLLELNHKIHAEEVAAGLWDKKGKKKEKITQAIPKDPGQEKMFQE